MASKTRAKSTLEGAASAPAKAQPKGQTQTSSKTRAKTEAPASKAAPIVRPPPSGYWLLKSEPDVFSWDAQVARGAKGEPWTGVRNYLARNNMRAMKVGDLAFFYHSNIGKEIVGIVRIKREAFPEPGDTTGTWECVEVEAVCPLPQPVGLHTVKAHPGLQSMSLVTCMRLSVQPVTVGEWTEICRLGGVDPARLKR